ncbi:hypothetical protein G7Y89_g4903 [Cudoniella acicularis]|uniref:N-acetyltransferase domain-containing protein n=1 Tax=Cudoniella acicularis TaxID=354080 RepID=A0A8H4W4A0_9HELO|nr:hypothetical protein G7Y89_g4903 [Cudoniella acicularis]
MTAPQAKKFRSSLETPRLSLSLYDTTTNNDAEWFSRFLTHPDVTAMMPVSIPINIEMLKAAETMWAITTEFGNGYEGFFTYMIRLKGSEEVVGCVTYRKMSELPDFGYGVLPEYWGKGYATEASAEVLRYLTKEVGLRTIIAETNKGHQGSQNILKKLGFAHDVDIDFPEEEGGPVEMFRYDVKGE